MSWVNGLLTGFDTETTGVDVEHDRIVTASLVCVGADRQLNQREWMLDPGIEIEPGAEAVHGISTAQAQAQGMDAAQGIAQIIKALVERAALGSPIIAFNARFDLTLLDREARRHGITPLFERGVPVYVIDPLVIDKTLDRYRAGKRTLEAICAHYGANLNQAHNASSDALAACRAAWVLGAKGYVKRREPRWESDRREKAMIERWWGECRHSLPRLHVAQTRWAAFQANGLERHFTKQGTPEPVSPHWPLIPFEAVQPQLAATAA